MFPSQYTLLHYKCQNYSISGGGCKFTLFFLNLWEGKKTKIISLLGSGKAQKIWSELQGMCQLVHLALSNSPLYGCFGVTPLATAAAAIALVTSPATKGKRPIART